MKKNNFYFSMHQIIFTLVALKVIPRWQRRKSWLFPPNYLVRKSDWYLVCREQLCTLTFFCCNHKTKQREIRKRCVYSLLFIVFESVFLFEKIRLQTFEWQRRMDVSNKARQNFHFVDWYDFFCSQEDHLYYLED